MWGFVRRDNFMSKNIKFISILLILTMIFSTINMPAFAKKSTVFSTDTLIECEDGDLGNDATVIKDKKDNNPSGHAYVILSTVSGMADVPSSKDKPDLKFTIKIEDKATYKLYVRVNIADDTQDSFHYRWDDGEWKTIHPGRTWSYSWINVTAQSLDVGEHTLSVSHREPNAMFDAIYLI